MSGRRIFVRDVRNSLDALRTAQAMEDCGATVISVAYDGEKQAYGALSPSSKFIVVAALPGELSDEAFEKTLDAIDAKAIS